LDREPLMAWTTLKAETTPELSKLCWGILLSDIQPATFKPWSNCLLWSNFLFNDLHISQDVQIVWGDRRQESDKGNWMVVIVVSGCNNYIKKSCSPTKMDNGGAEKLLFSVPEIGGNAYTTSLDTNQHLLTCQTQRRPLTRPGEGAHTTLDFHRAQTSGWLVW
jgi:hypothetical protein